MPGGASQVGVVVGRGFQALGLVLLPVGLWHGVARGEGMTTELALLGGGVAAFLLGTGILRLQGGR